MNKPPMGQLVLVIAHFLLVNWFNFAKNMFQPKHTESIASYSSNLFSIQSAYILIFYTI